MRFSSEIVVQKVNNDLFVAESVDMIISVYRNTVIGACSNLEKAILAFFESADGNETVRSLYRLIFVAFPERGDTIRDIPVVKVIPPVEGLEEGELVVDYSL